MAEEAWLQDRQRMSESEKVTPVMLSRVGSFLFVCSQNLKEWPSVVSIQNSDQANSHTKWHCKTCWDVSVVQEQDWRNARFSSECVVQWWSPLLSIWLCQQQELCVLGSSSARWSPSETNAPCEMHHMGRHIQTWHNRTFWFENAGDNYGQ